MLKVFFLFMLIFLSHGQSESFFREHYFRKRPKEELRKYTWQVWGKVFLYDLNDDGLLEGLQSAKKDQEDWFYIRKNKGDILAKYRLETQGREAQVYRVKLNQIANDLKLLTVYFYNGFTEGFEFHATTTLYFITFRPSNMGLMKMTKGPSIWLEHEVQNSYIQRDYQIKLKDIDQDGTKEVVIEYGHIRRIFQYFPDQGMGHITI